MSELPRLSLQRQANLFAIGDLIQRERLARDGHRWSEMASYYHSDSSIDLSWFQGSGADFVEASKRTVRPNMINLHVMSPAVVRLNADRALAETPCSLRGFSDLDGMEISYEGYVQLLWRARFEGANWRIAGLRVIYVRDLLHACSPNRSPNLDMVKLAGFRPSYRYLSYMLSFTGLTPRNDLPGQDRPDLVAALREGEERWLVEA